MLLEFYAASGDFTRRLTSVKANSKFSAPDAGPEDYFSVRAQHSPCTHHVSPRHHLRYVRPWCSLRCSLNHCCFSTL